MKKVQLVTMIKLNDNYAGLTAELETCNSLFIDGVDTRDASFRVIFSSKIDPYLTGKQHKVIRALEGKRVMVTIDVIDELEET